MWRELDKHCVVRFMFINKERWICAETNVDTQRISLIWTSAICNLPLPISTNSDHFQRQSELYVRILTNQTIPWKSYYIALAVSRMCLVCTWYVLEQHFESQTMLHRWDLGHPRTNKNGKCSRPDERHRRLGRLISPPLNSLKYLKECWTCFETS